MWRTTTQALKIQENNARRWLIRQEARLRAQVRSDWIVMPEMHHHKVQLQAIYEERKTIAKYLHQEYQDVKQ